VALVVVAVVVALVAGQVAAQTQAAAVLKTKGSGNAIA